MGDIIKENLNHDGIDRRGFLKCMAWAGTGTLCVMQGGVLKSFAFGHPGTRSFVQFGCAFCLDWTGWIHWTG